MKSFYQVVKQADLVYAPSVVVISPIYRYQDTYKEVCHILRVCPVKKVGRSSFMANKLRETADEIAKYWIEEDNPCKHVVNYTSSVLALLILVPALNNRFRNGPRAIYSGELC